MFISYLYMFRATMCPPSGEITVCMRHLVFVTLCECLPVVIHTGSFDSLQPGHLSSLSAPNFQPTANQQRDDQCGNQHYIRELLMMGIVVPETC